jgi:methyl-accepting chemotaxis protein
MIRTVADSVSRISSYQVTIASAVEEQTASTNKMSANTHNAATA